MFIRKPKGRRIGAVLGAVLAITGMMGFESVAAPAAGTQITNVAEASFFNPLFGVRETVTSNRVVATVLSVPAFDVFGGETQRLTRDVASFYSFRVENSGNTPLSVFVDIEEQQSGDDFDVAGTLFLDIDNNGRVDPGDPEVTDFSELTLPTGSAATLLYEFQTPLTVVQDDEAVTLFTARADEAIDAPATDAVTLRTVTTVPAPDALPLSQERESRAIIDESFLQIEKQADHDTDNGEISYTLQVRNDGAIDLAPYTEINGDEVSLDGVSLPIVLIRDEIPLNTNFVRFGETGGQLAAYHIFGDPLHAYVSVLPDDLASIDAVAFINRGAFPGGSSAELEFTVAISDHVGEAEILNTAVGFVDGGTEIVAASSNEVFTPVSGDAELRFFDTTLENELTTIGFGLSGAGEATTVMLESGLCNVSREIDEVVINITTELSDDFENVLARETGPNTGIFTTQALPTNSDPTQIQDRVIQAQNNDRVVATAVCDGVTVQDTIFVNQGGTVFNSVTLDPVEGVSVRVVDATGTPVTDTVLTDAAGFFSFGVDVEPCDCRFEVEPPVELSFPSVITTFPGFNGTVTPDASFGQSFAFGGGAIAGINIPLDPATLSLPITLDKTANTSEVRRGEYIVYTLDAFNEMSLALQSATITDTLPSGILYVDGSATREGEAIDDPVQTGNVLEFPLGTLAPDSGTQISFVGLAGPTAGQGRKVNRAVLTGNRANSSAATAARTSNEATAVVDVDDRGGVFSEESCVIGRVFLDYHEFDDLDLNGDDVITELNGVQDRGLSEELGVPGVKIITSNGLSVVTDEFGRYSICGLPPRTTVFALQKATLPLGAEIAPYEIDDALDPGSRFVDLRKSQLRSEDFPLIHTPELEEKVRARAEAFFGLDEDESLLRDDLPLTFSGGVTPLSSNTQDGIDTTTDIIDGEEVRRSVGRDRAVNVNESLTENERQTRLEALLPSLDPSTDFVGMADELIVARPSMDIVVKGTAAGTLGLRVNGEEVPGTQIGTKLTDHTAGIQIFEYIAVPLQPGSNLLEAIILDPFGNERGGATRTVIAPDKPTQLAIEAPDEVPSDARARVPVVVRLLDAAGIPVLAPAEVTLSAQRGRWDVRDIRDQVPGIQTYIDNGAASFDYIPPDLVGSDTLRAEADFGHGEEVVRISPNLEERIFVGVVEGAVKINGDDFEIQDIIDDDEISQFEDTTQGVRGQLYLKGRILGDALLTLRYDSDQDTNERLFRDIARDEFYPVYGDNAESGFDAQSSSELYVKVERRQSYILYGDIAVEPLSDAIRLGNFRRSLTGGELHIEEGPVSLTLFAAETEQRQRIIEVPGLGISGPYDVDLDGIIDGSEVVEIITRERDQQSIIIDELRQTRLTDYTIDFFDGSIIFNRPIPQLDDDLNPISIRITYETEEFQGDDFFVYGGELHYSPTESIGVGVRHVRSDADFGADDISITSAYAEADFGTYGKAEIEVTRSENEGGVDGLGVRAEYERKSSWTTTRVEIIKTDDDFEVPGSAVSGGREEARITAQQAVTDRLTLSEDVIYSRDTTNDDERYGIEARATYDLNDEFDVSAGGRAVRTVTEDSETDVISGIVGVTYTPKRVPGLALEAEYEQDFADTNNWRALVGADYQYNPDLRFFALNEISPTETGFFGIGDSNNTNFTTRVGVEYRLNENIETFSEYRNGGFGRGGAVNGFNANWAATEYLTLRSGFEHVEPIEDDDERSTSATGGFVYSNPEEGYIIRSDAEWNQRAGRDTYFSNLAFGWQYEDSLTLLVRNRLAYDDSGEGRVRDRLRFGFAYRPWNDTRHKALGWYEYEIDDDQTTKDQSHRWSLGGAYTHSDQWRLNYRYAGKYTEFNSTGIDTANTLHMGLVESEIELVNNRLSLLGNIAAFSDEEFDNYTFGVGAEAKVNVARNLQIGIGYNYTGLDAEDLDGIYESGFYLRGKLKFGENIWDTFDREVEAFSQQRLELLEQPRRIPEDNSDASAILAPKTHGVELDWENAEIISIETRK